MFSIIVPTYNSEKTVYNTILSILNQDYYDFELIVVDNNSLDSTKLIVESFKDTRISFHLIDNKGMPAISRNYGISIAKFDFIAFCDSIKSITGCFVRLLNSVELAPFNPHTCLAKSIIAHCIPKHIPKKGTLFSLAYFEDKIFPSLPLVPKPGNIKIPSTFLNSFNFTFSICLFQLATTFPYTISPKIWGLVYVIL